MDLKSKMVVLALLVTLSIVFHLGCSNSSDLSGGTIEPVKVDEVVVQNEPHQPEVIMEGLQVTDSGIAYGVDFRRGLPFRLSLIDGSFEHLGESGRGPEELTQPNQVYLVSGERQYVNDQALDMITEISDGQVSGKQEGFLAHNVWIRNTYGVYSDGKLISDLKDHQHVNELNFQEARAIYILDLESEEGEMMGKFSTTLDQLDAHKKYPFIEPDMSGDYLYYIFNTDYSVFRLNLINGDIEATSRYRPEQHRERTIEFDFNNNFHFTTTFSREFNMDLTNVSGIGVLEDQLVVVWYHANQNYYEKPFYDSENFDYFGVVYDLPDLTNPREFSLPGKLLGVWNNRMLIQENDDVMEYTIGFYVFEE